MDRLEQGDQEVKAERARVKLHMEEHVLMLLRGTRLTFAEKAEAMERALRRYGFQARVTG